MLDRTHEVPLTQAEQLVWLHEMTGIERQLGFKVSGRWIEHTDNTPKAVEQSSEVWESAKEIGTTAALSLGFTALVLWRITPVGFAVTSAASLLYMAATR